MTKQEPARQAQPALLPLHGVQDKKARYLDREAITIGRAYGCDVALDAPDISQLHCVITRTPEGFRIRDCNSRAGTKINGEGVKSCSVSDGDVLQIGPFSFTLFIPVNFLPGKAIDSARVERLERSRRHLGKLALRARHKLAKFQEKGLCVTPNELNRKASGLKAQIRGFDQRLTDLEESERDLDADRDKLQREREVHERHVQQVAEDQRRRLAKTEEEIRQQWHEFQQRCRIEEQALVELSRKSKDSGPSAEELHSLKRQLDEQKNQLERERHQLAQDLQELHQKQQEIKSMLEQLNGHQSGLDREEQQADLARVEAGLAQQRRDLARMVADLQKMQDSLRPTAPDADLEGLLQDNERLRDHVRQLEENLTSPGGDDVRKLREENAVLRQLLEVQNAAPPAVSQETLQEIADLRRLLEEKSHELAAAKKQPVAPAPMKANDLENYETELNQFRQQLERDQAKLNAEIDNLRQRNEELDEATREMEMAMSRERAELARERTRLDRLREETRLEMERMQREGPVRESLVNVNKLREEMSQKKQPAGAPPLNDRLKNLRTKLSE